VLRGLRRFGFEPDAHKTDFTKRVYTTCHFAMFVAVARTGHAR
jgi:hypothetical protein